MEKLWCKKLICSDSSFEASSIAARMYFDIANANPESTVLLPTGRASRDLFYGMLRKSKDYEKPFGDAKVMNDTETFGVNPDDPTSRVRRVNEGLMNILKAMGKAPKDENLTYFNGIGDARKPEDIAFYNLSLNPVSVAGVSISPFGEIIGYEPNKYDDSIVNDNPRVLEVGDNTKNYIDKAQATNKLYSVGLKAILDSDTLLIFALTMDKAEALKMLLTEEPNAKHPITLLRKHPNAYIFTTNEIFNKIKQDLDK